MHAKWIMAHWPWAGVVIPPLPTAFTLAGLSREFTRVPYGRPVRFMPLATVAKLARAVESFGTKAR